jgi:tight adherence protein B
MTLFIILALTFLGSLVLIVLISRMGTSTLMAGTRRVGGEIESSLADAFVFVNRQKAAAWGMLVMIGFPIVMKFVQAGLL